MLAAIPLGDDIGRVTRLPRLAIPTGRRAALLLLGFIAAAIAAYAGSPYVALYRLSRAAAAGDAGPLIAAVDWQRLKDGVRQAIEDGIAGGPVAKTNDDDLPPFGSGFLTDMASRITDEQVSPAHLSAMLDTMRLAPGHSGGMTVIGAHFTGLRRFVVAIRPVGAPRGSTIKVRLAFDGAAWRIVGADMPPSVLGSLAPKSG